MKTVWNTVQTVFAALGGIVGGILGGADGFLYALIAFIAIDYVTGVLAAGYHRELSSKVGFKGIARKVAIFCIVGVANILDVYVLGENAILRTAVIFFYISNEGISILENAAELGLPFPEKMKNVLEQLRHKPDKNDGEDK